MLDESISTYLPSWLVRLDAPPSSRDPLGLQAQAMSHADLLLPGLNVFTSRARYYTFLCWALRIAQSEEPARGHLDRVQRLERLLVLTEALRHQENPDACSYIGRRRGRRFINERPGSNLWDLPTKILKNQSSNGALRLYRTSLADLGLIEESDLEEGLGLRLTFHGEQLAKQFDKADPSVVAWALANPADQQKRRNTLLDGTKSMCLSARLGGIERRYLIARLFGLEGNGIERRETVQVLFENGLLTPASSGDDLAGDDADLVADDDGKPAEAATANETRGNWAVLRRALEIQPSNRLRKIQIAAAYEVLALGLNALLSAVLEPAQIYGRVGIAAWCKRVAERAGSDFYHASATTWAKQRRIVDIAADLLSGYRPWQELAPLAIELLIRATQGKRVSAWLADNPTPIVDRILFWGRHAGRDSAASLAARLLPDLIEHHAEVSARKGKGEWIQIDGNEMVRGDPRPLRLTLHSLRFAQLQQIAADLKLREEDVTDEP